ncbi:mitochondrial ribosomal protein L30 [Augochlora pura]
MTTKLLNPTSVLLTFVRYRLKPRAWKQDAVKYGEIRYYPRKKNEVDPPITPSKVFMVTRVKPYKGNPWWHKKTLAALGIDETKIGPAFVKNTPEMCSLLWSIKHLIKITPVKLPEGEIKADDGIEYYFNPNGTLHICGKIDPARREATEKFRNSMTRMEYNTIAEKLRLQWIKGTLI